MSLLSGFSSSKSSSSSRSQSQSTMPVERQPEYYSTESGSSETQSGDNFNMHEERLVKETKTRSVPTYVDMPATRLEPITTHYTSMPLEPVTVRWDCVTPDAITPERKLQYLDQDMRRLAGEMNRLWDHQTAYRRQVDTAVHPLNQSAMTYHRSQDLSRPVNQAALDRELEMKRLWNQAAASYTSPSPSLPLMPFQPPQGFVKLTHSARPDMLWGDNLATAHAETWRKKENFHIDNPIIHSSDGHSQFRLEFDMRQFKPEEIEVTTRDGMLTVQAKHEETDQGKQVRREYFRQFTIPEDVECRDIVSKLTQSGCLSVSAPLARPALEEKTREITVKAV